MLGTPSSGTTIGPLIKSICNKTFDILHFDLCTPGHPINKTGFGIDHWMQSTFICLSLFELRELCAVGRLTKKATKYQDLFRAGKYPDN